MKIYSWNVNGIRAVLKKGTLQSFLKEHSPDIICLQETKAKQGQAEIDLPDYEEFWYSAERAGYSGTAIFTKTTPLSVSYGFPEAIAAQFANQDGSRQTPAHDQVLSWQDQFGDARKEGRIMTAEYPQFFLINVYAPNEKDDLGRLKYRELVWDKALLAHLRSLDQQKPVLVCGDFNVAHEEIDLARPDANRGHAGFTDEGRQGMTNYISNGFIDTWRTFHPTDQKYTWWSYRGGARQRNVGWRIDYFLASQRLLPKPQPTQQSTPKDTPQLPTIVKAEIFNDILGSDHCPIGVELDV